MRKRTRNTMLSLLLTVIMLPGTAFAGVQVNDPGTDAPGSTEGAARQTEVCGTQDLDAQNLDAQGLDAQDLDAQGFDAQGFDAQGLDAQDEPVGAEQSLFGQLKKVLPVLLGVTGDDPQSRREWAAKEMIKIAKNPKQYLEDFLDSLFGTGADGISLDPGAEKEGKVKFVMELPEPVRMPAVYSIAYRRLDNQGSEVTTLLERDADGNIHYVDGDEELVFLRTDKGFRMYPVPAGADGFGEWDGILLSARSVRERTAPFWNCADQTFMKWLGATLTEKTQYLGRPCGLYHAAPGALTFTYNCDMAIDDETGVCLSYAADELLKGAVYTITKDNTIEIDIEDYDIGGEEMNFFCTTFETEDVSFAVP